MRPSQPNLLNSFKDYLDNHSGLSKSTAETYWSDFGVVVRAVLESHDNESLQALVEKMGYSGNYQSAVNHARRVAQETESPRRED